jgi:hypothetical protein
MRGLGSCVPWMPVVVLVVSVVWACGGAGVPLPWRVRRAVPG